MNAIATAGRGSPPIPGGRWRLKVDLSEDFQPHLDSLQQKHGISRNKAARIALAKGLGMDWSELQEIEEHAARRSRETGKVRRQPSASQRRVLAYLSRCIVENGFSPTGRRIADDLNMHRSTVAENLKALEERGLIDRRRHADGRPIPGGIRVVEDAHA